MGASTVSAMKTPTDSEQISDASAQDHDADQKKKSPDKDKAPHDADLEALSLENIRTRVLLTLDTKVKDSRKRAVNPRFKETASKKDESLLDSIAEMVLDVCISAATAGVGAHILKHCEKYFEKDSPAGEIFKTFIAEGSKAGVKGAISAAKGAGGESGDLGEFAMAQDRLVDEDYNWRAIQTLESIQDKKQGIAVLKGLNDLSDKEVEDAQYVATRDAWVSYIAKSEKLSPIQAAIQQGQTKEERLQMQLGGEIAGAAMGGGKGKLQVYAKLPRILGQEEGNLMDGKPDISTAVLNGVNEAMRSQYEDKTLAEIHIPRQIICDPKGMDNFVVNVAEDGATEHLGGEAWLKHRAVSGYGSKKEEDGTVPAGIQLLLEDLRLGSVKRFDH
jgi:hypothetical protein